MNKKLLLLFFPLFTLSCIQHDLRIFEAEQAGKDGNIQKAIALYQSVDENLEDPVIAYNCAVLYTKLNEYEAALNVYKKLLKKDIPERIRIAVLYNSAHILYEKKDYSDAVKLLRTALTRTQDEAVIMLYQCALARLDPGTGTTSITALSATIGPHDAQTEALLFTPVPYGLLFPGDGGGRSNASDY